MLPERGATPSRPDRIVELERKLDTLLRDRAESLHPLSAARTTAREWSKAVWSEAQALGPAPLAPSEIERGLSLARRPVFICGVARSGTTLLRDLLDGHPQLAVLPTESLFYTDMEPLLFGLRADRHSALLISEWLERLVYPPPRWLLGPALPRSSAYVSFARKLAAWWEMPARRSEARTSSWPLAALALAYAQHLGNGSIPHDLQMWVEKSLANERFLDRIWRDFPAAKVVHIVRRPESVLASLKAMQGHAWSYRNAARMCLRYMAPSYGIAAQSAGQLPAGRYCLVKYEDLTARPEQVMSEVADFLGIEPLPQLSRPSVAGLPAANNSSFGEKRPDPARSLDAIERALLAVTVASSAARLGYQATGPQAWAADPVVGAPEPAQRSFGGGL